MIKGSKPEPGQPYPELDAMILHLVLGAPRVEVRKGRSKLIRADEYKDRELVLQSTREELSSQFSPKSQYVVVKFAPDEYYAEKLQQTSPDKPLPFALGNRWPSELGFSECVPYETRSRDGKVRTGDYQFIDVVKRIRSPEGEMPIVEQHILVIDKDRFENAAIKVLSSLGQANDQGLKISGFKKQADLIGKLADPASELAKLSKRIAANLLFVEGVKAGVPILKSIEVQAQEAGNYRFAEIIQDAIADGKARLKGWTDRIDEGPRGRGGRG